MYAPHTMQSLMSPILVAMIDDPPMPLMAFEEMGWREIKSDCSGDT